MAQTQNTADGYDRLLENSKLQDLKRAKLKFLSVGLAEGEGR